ncbi:MAG TPA: DUF802 domain-containing protein, partial [Burkholderiaceae bacterium]
MNRSLYYAAFFVGLGAVAWIGAGYVGTNPLALAMTVLVGGFYLMGALELQRFEQATWSLSRALSALRDPPATLGHWLDQLHPSLQNAARLRIEGERVGLPGPAMTPYLAGLLVLLGMLGTFLGMVVTLNGTGSALESATDLQAIRASLAAPVKGLGLAFGTSVAGVAASAMLGLMSALCRRARLQAAQILDTKIATTLRTFSLAHQREESFKLLQCQAQVMPELVERLQAMMAQMERQSLALNTRLVAGQESFHSQAEAAYAGLAASVDRSLKESLTESARVAGATIQPVVEATMAGIARESAAVHRAIADTVQRQLDGVSQRFDATTTAVADIWKTAIAQHQEELASRDQQRLAVWARTLEHTARDIAEQTGTQARNTITEIAHLVQVASDAPRAAAEVMAELRHQLSQSVARDNAVLEERSRIMETLRTLLDALNRVSAEQRGAIDALV